MWIINIIIIIISVEPHTIFHKISIRLNCPKCQIMLQLQIKLNVKSKINLTIENYQ